MSAKAGDKVSGSDYSGTKFCRIWRQSSLTPKLENTAFHQWIRYWNLNHVFRHTSNALHAVLLIWMLAFNLLQLFVYRRLKRLRRPKDPTDTLRHIVEVMLRDSARLPEPIPWSSLLDTS